MSAPCPECDRRDRDRQFDDSVFASCILTSATCGLLGSLISTDVAVWGALLGGLAGWLVGWRVFAKRGTST